MTNTLATSAGKATLTFAMGAEALGAIYDLRWMLVLVVLLILSDFWFGVSESLHKHEHFRFSRAGRRTCNKFGDYFFYLLIGDAYYDGSHRTRLRVYMGDRLNRRSRV